MDARSPPELRHPILELGTEESDYGIEDGDREGKRPHGVMAARPSSPPVGNALLAEGIDKAGSQVRLKDRVFASRQDEDWELRRLPKVPHTK